MERKGEEMERGREGEEERELQLEEDFRVLTPLT